MILLRTVVTNSCGIAESTALFRKFFLTLPNKSQMPRLTITTHARLGIGSCPRILLTVGDPSARSQRRLERLSQNCQCRSLGPSRMVGPPLDP